MSPRALPPDTEAGNPAASETLKPRSFRKRIPGKLVLQDGAVFDGYSFGAQRSVSGEVVFATGMTGYPETLTDPSYHGHILTFTFPLVGNYGVPHKQDGNALGLPFESSRLQTAALLVSDYSEAHSHWDAQKSLGEWLEEEGVPALTGIDTRALTKRLREAGSMLGRVIIGDGEEPDWYDPHAENLLPKVSIKAPQRYGSGDRCVAVIDCGGKNNIIQCLVDRGVEVLRVPWDYDVSGEDIHGVMITNGPGDPKKSSTAIHNTRRLLTRRIPVFGICLGHQILSLAIGADTYKLKYGHRSQNQPVIDEMTQRCFVTSQNHGYAVDAESLPEGWLPWFTNLNDGTNEGIRHTELPAFSVQFHPEAAPGPVDTEWLFDDLVRLVRK